MSSAPSSTSSYPTNVPLPTPKFPSPSPPTIILPLSPTVFLTPPLSAWLELERRSGLLPPLLSPPSPLSGLPPVPPSFPLPPVPIPNTTAPDPDTVRCTLKHDANVARLRSATDAEAPRGTKRQIAERQRGPSWTHSDANAFIHTHMNRPRLPGEAPAVTPPLRAPLPSPPVLELPPGSFSRWKSADDEEWTVWTPHGAMMEQQQRQNDSDQQQPSGTTEQQQPSSSGKGAAAVVQQTQRSSSSRARENSVGNGRSAAAAAAADPTNPTDTVRPSKSARIRPTLPPALRRYHNPAFAPPRSCHPPTPEELQELDLLSNTSSSCSSPSTSPARYDTKLGDYVKTDEHGNDLA